ncbi:MAG: TIGR03643 family protein [Bizionia sp.]|nr:TIGR03643 family protein [Bizionia sp.]
MAWEDRTPFEAITFQFKTTEKDVISIMRRQLKPSSFRLWRARVQGRATKHQKRRTFTKGTFKSTRQKLISNNSISKR